MYYTHCPGRTKQQNVSTQGLCTKSCMKLYVTPGVTQYFSISNEKIADNTDLTSGVNGEELQP